MNIPIKIEYTLNLDDCNIDTLSGVFKKLQPMILTDLIMTVLIAFAVEYMKKAKKPFKCQCGNDEDFAWKTKNAKPTKIFTVFSEVILGQLQVKCCCCGKKKYITRELLDIAPRCKMSQMTQKVFALIGSLATFRVSEKIVGMLGCKLNKMAIWRSVQKEGSNIKFDVDVNESNSFQADGTGIPIKGIKKRGQELKVFIQEKISGGIRIAGLDLGSYHGGWDKLFEPVMESLKMFKEVLLLTDGDTSILKGLKNIEIIVQRCLWHIPHQAKYTMWQDKLKRKSDDWLFIMSQLFQVTTLPRLVYDEQIIEEIIQEKKFLLNELIKHCFTKGYSNTAQYLYNAREDMFSAFQKKMNGRTTSLVERVMRTVNLRINVGKWSTKGALNALRIRLAYYYNDYDVDDTYPGINKIEKL